MRWKKGGDGGGRCLVLLLLFGVVWDKEGSWKESKEGAEKSRAAGNNYKGANLKGRKRKGKGKGEKNKKEGEEAAKRQERRD